MKYGKVASLSKIFDLNDSNRAGEEIVGFCKDMEIGVSTTKLRGMGCNVCYKPRTQKSVGIYFCLVQSIIWIHLRSRQEDVMHPARDQPTEDCWETERGKRRGTFYKMGRRVTEKTQHADQRLKLPKVIIVSEASYVQGIKEQISGP